MITNALPRFFMNHSVGLYENKYTIMMHH